MIKLLIIKECQTEAETGFHQVMVDTWRCSKKQGVEREGSGLCAERLGDREGLADGFIFLAPQFC